MKKNTDKLESYAIKLKLCQLGGILDTPGAIRIYKQGLKEAQKLGRVDRWEHYYRNLKGEQ